MGQTKFFIISHGRSGSSNLVKMLNNLEGVYCENEVLASPRMRKLYGKYTFDDKMDVIDSFFTDHKDSVSGFKIFTKHVNLKNLHLSIKENHPNLKYIYLLRPDLWETTLSWAIATTTNKWNFSNGSKVNQQYPDKLKVPLKRYNNAFTKVTNDQNYIDDFFKTVPHLKINYVNKRYENIESIFDFLNIPKQEIKDGLELIDKDGFYKKLVSNYDELKSCYLERKSKM